VYLLLQFATEARLGHRYLAARLQRTEVFAWVTPAVPSLLLDILQVADVSDELCWRYLCCNFLRVLFAYHLCSPQSSLIVVFCSWDCIWQCHW